MFLRTMAKILFPDAAPVINIIPDSQKLALILGWGGGKQKHLSALQKFYAHHRISTVTHVMPLWIPLFLRTYFEDEIFRCVSSLSNYSTNCIIVHSFSNNGMWVYGSLVQRGLIRPKVAILDSAAWLPLEPLDAITEAKMLSMVAISTILRKPVYSHVIWTPIFQLLLYSTIVTSQMLKHIQGSLPIVPDLLQLNRYIVFDQPVVSTLLIYSLGDALIPPDVIVKFSDMLKNRGFPITEKVFGHDVPHVASSFSRRDEYFETVRQFLMPELDAVRK